MKPEAQRIAIAEACGAKIATKAFRTARGFATGQRWEWEDGNPCAHPGGGLYGWGWSQKASENELPNYLNDLNAMHEAEKVLAKEQCYTYSNLCGAGLGDWKPSSLAANWPFHATAAQRAEAFLRCTGRWIE